MNKTSEHDPNLVAALETLKAKLEALPESLRGPFIVKGLSPYATPAPEPQPEVAAEPVSNYDDTGLPAWQEISRCLGNDGAHLPQHVRDELAGMLLWARYGKAQVERRSVGTEHGADCGCWCCT